MKIMKIQNISIALLAIGLLACSWPTNLVIINNTNEPIKITYYLKKHDMQSGNKEYMLTTPKLMEPNAIPLLANDLPSHSYEYDNVMGRVITNVPPGKALWVDMTSNYSGMNPESYSYNINMARLVIKAKGATKVYEGVDILKAFRKYSWNPFNNTIYALIIK